MTMYREPCHRELDQDGEGLRGKIGAKRIGQVEIGRVSY
jgi:hypothetical protein